MAVRKKRVEAWFSIRPEDLRQVLAGRTKVYRVGEEKVGGQLYVRFQKMEGTGADSIEVIVRHFEWEDEGSAGAPARNAER